jgi:DNA-binding transcriptional regulator WhiA
MLKYKDTKKLTHLLAMIMSDGGISKERNGYEIYFIQKYIEPCMYFKNLLEDLFGVSVSIKKRNDGTFIARVKNREIFNYLQSLIGGIKKEERIIPDFIINNEELGKEFLKVFFGCEGSACYDKKRDCIKIEIACKSLELKLQLQKLLEKHGISSKIYENSLQIRRKDSVIKFIRNVGTLDCFNVGRGKFKGWKKVDLLRFLIKMYRNPSSN